MRYLFHTTSLSALPKILKGRKLQPKSFDVPVEPLTGAKLSSYRVAYRYSEGSAFGDLPPGFGGFDDAEEQAPLAVGAEVEKLMGSLPQTLDGTRLLKPSLLGKLTTPAVYYFRPQRSWMVKVGDSAMAQRVGRQAYKSLVGKRSLSAADPFLHHMTLYVAYPGGYVKVDAPEERSRDTGKTDQKYKTLSKAKELLGARGAKLSGQEGAYVMELIPYLRQYRNKLRLTRIVAPTLDLLDQRVDEALAKIREL